MAFSYNDLNDLIQNQRALAELVGEIKANYDAFQTDINYVREVDARIQQLNSEMTTIMNNFSTQMSNLDGRMTNMLAELQASKDNLEAELNRCYEALKFDATKNPASLDKLIDDIAYLHNRIARGVLKDPSLDPNDPNSYTGGMDNLLDRIKGLERKSPPIVLYDTTENVPDDKKKSYIHYGDIPVTDRVEGQFYGRVTNQVTDIESGQVIKISPYLQGVVVGEDGKVKQ